MHTGGIYSNSVRKLPSEQDAIWREAGNDLAYKQMYHAANIFYVNITPALDRYELLPQSDRLVAMNGNLHLQELILLQVKSYIGYFDNEELEIPIEIIDLITRVVQFDEIVENLDKWSVLSMLNILQRHEGVAVTEP